MAVTIHVNGKSNSLVHKGSMGIAKSTIPDVCKTPTPGGPVPIPYPIIVSMSSDLKKGTKTIKVDGKNMAAIKGSEFSRCTGDEPGTAGGVKSSTNMKEATWLLYSFDVKLDGKNACRLSDKMMMNHGNTVCLGGEIQIPVAGATIPECKEATKNANDADEMTSHLKSGEENSAVAGGVFKPTGGGSYPVRGTNFIAAGQVIPGRRYNRFARGIGRDDESGVTCGGKPFDYQRGRHTKTGHAEAKIIEDIFAGRTAGFKPGAGRKPPGKLYLQVKGNTKGKKGVKPVCCHCQELIACAKEAGLEVILCEPSEVEKPCP